MNFKLITTGLAGLIAMTALVPANYINAEMHDKKDEPRASVKWGTAGDAPRQIMKRAIESHKLLKRSNPDGLPASVTDKAKCVAIIPGVVTAAAAVGGSHGDGVAICKISATQWSRPAFVDIDAASLGLQLGAKSSDMIVYMLSDRAAEALKDGDFVFGADVSVVAGNFERSLDTSRADVVAYQNNDGAYAGASIGAGKITSDDDSNKAFYGKEFKSREILNGNVRIDDETADTLSEQL